MERETGTSPLRVIALGAAAVATVALAVACSFIVNFDLPADAGQDGSGPCARDSDCDDDNPCTVDRCGDDGECVFTDAEEGTSCEGTFACVEGETCDGGGACDPASGSTVTCAGDDNPCTADLCDEEFGGCYRAEPAGTSCEGTFFCREGETCDDEGACDPSSGAAHDCDDDNPCTADGCSEAAAACSNEPVEAGTSCEGTFFCREGETCDAEGSCDSSTGTARDCADTIPCTADGCSEATAECTHEPDHSLCTIEGFGWCDPEDGGANDEGCTAGKPCPGGTDAECDDLRFCNGAETCGVGNRCEAGPAPVCDDGATCSTGDWCNPALDGPDGPGGTQGACEFTPSDSECDDSLDCTRDVCDPESPTAHATTGCVFPAVTCTADGNPCTRDVCDETFGGCGAPEPATTSCEGTYACRAGETCGAGTGACNPTSGTAVTCADDGNPCTLEACTEPAGCATTDAPDTTSCEGTFDCLTGETCDGSGDCDPASGAAVTCTDDGDPCTLETCDEVFGGCHPPVTACTGTVDGCCPAACTHVSTAAEFDRDCCDARACDLGTADSCCPAACDVATDADCT